MNRPIVTVGIVVPVHNEQDNIAELARRVWAVVQPIADYDFRLLFVDDGSTDNTVLQITQLQAQPLPVGLIKLTKNYGHQAALDAGLMLANTDLVITMDGDLQHPPEEIPRMLEAYRLGADVVQMKRENLSWHPKGLLSLGFYTFFNWVSPVKMVSNAADFRLLSTVALQKLRTAGERSKMLRVEVPALGLRQIYLGYQQDERKHGVPSYTFSSSYQLAVDTVFLYSKFPLHVLLGLAMLSVLFCLLAGVMLVSGLVVFSLGWQIALGAAVVSAAGLVTGAIIAWYFYYTIAALRQEKSYTVQEIVWPKTREAHG